LEPIKTHTQFRPLTVYPKGRTPKYDYFKLSGALIEASTGQLILRRTYPIKTNVTNYTMNRVLPAVGSKININVRSGNTIDEVQAASYSPATTGTVTGNIETGYVNVAPGSIFDIKLDFIKASPSPLLYSFDFTTSPQAVDDDLPIILSVDEAGPGLAMVTSSEEGLSETANTKKLMDGDTNAQWTSMNASDTTSSTLQVSFLTAAGGGDVRTFNAVILRNTNIKALRVYAGTTTYFDGEILDDDVIIPFPTVTMPVIQLEAKTTKVPNQNKKIGELYCGQILIALPSFSSYTPQRELFESGNLRTLGGKLIAYRGKNKFGGKWRVIFLDSATKDAVELIFKQNPLVTFWPEPKARPRDLFDVCWKVETLPFAYSDVFKNAGYTIEAEVTEI
jgi:hypothetical protein